MAKKFSFELQDVLDFRNFEKEQAEAELAKALAVETEIQDKLNNIAGQFIALKKTADTLTDFEDIAAANKHKIFLEYQKEELLKELAQAQLVTAQKREVLAEVMKKTTALEKLKEKQQAAYNEKLNKEENDFIDDLANARASNGMHFHQ
ncbi:MAG: flagellar export protein FliJ [Treponema sp.]|nr:flagellar export protein FliJ [Treponema sp.]